MSAQDIELGGSNKQAEVSGAVVAKAGSPTPAVKLGDGTAAEATSEYPPVIDIVRHVFSAIITLGAIGLIFYGIGAGYAALPGHPTLLYIIFFSVLILLAYLEGLQVAILALEHTNIDGLRERYPRAHVTHALSTAYDGLNVQRFLVGRQFFVVFVVFLCAQLTTYPELPKGGVPGWLFTAIIETGLPGALVVLAFGQLMPQLLAATHPVVFMNLHGTWLVVQIALGFESLGVTHFSWLLTSMVKYVFKMDAGGDPSMHLHGDGSGSGSDGYAALCFNTEEGGDDDGKALLSSWGYVKGHIEMDPSLLNAAQLFDGAEQGMDAASEDDVSSKETEEWLKRSSQNRMAAILTGKSSESEFPSPADLVRHRLHSGEPVPRYLLPPHHEKHIPPHIVAYDMIRRQEAIARVLNDANETQTENQRLVALLKKVQESGAGSDGALSDEIKEALAKAP